MCVLRRLDAVLEPTKPAVLAQKQLLDSAGIAADLKSRAGQQQLLADFEDYLNGFSANDSLGTLIAKFLDPEIDLSPAGIDNHSMGLRRTRPQIQLRH